MAADSEASDSEERLSANANQLLDYLQNRLEVEGTFYAKSRYIADEIDLSAKEVGAAMRKLKDRQVPVQIEKWGYTNGTTWRITRA